MSVSSIIAAGSSSKLFTLETRIITAGVSGSSSGFSDVGGYGSIDNASYKSGSIIACYYDSTQQNTYFQMTPQLLPQNLFRALRVIGPNWNVYLETADAIFVGSGVSSWRWSGAQSAFSSGQQYTLQMIE